MPNKGTRKDEVERGETESFRSVLTDSAFDALLGDDDHLVLWLTERCAREPKLRRAVKALVASILTDAERAGPAVDKLPAVDAEPTGDDQTPSASPSPDLRLVR